MEHWQQQKEEAPWRNKQVNVPDDFRKYVTRKASSNSETRKEFEEWIGQGPRELVLWEGHVARFSQGRKNSFVTQNEINYPYREEETHALAIPADAAPIKSKHSVRASCYLHRDLSLSARTAFDT